MHIDSNGNELTDSALETTNEYTPNYSSPVYLTSHGPLAYLAPKVNSPGPWERQCFALLWMNLRHKESLPL